MGFYKDITFDFIDRTLSIIEQYEIVRYEFEEEEQYNHTLLINCLLGIIVMPKEIIFDQIPKDRLTKTLKEEMGLLTSSVNTSITTLKRLIRDLRHAIAHFNVEVLQHNNSGQIDQINFKYDDGSYIVQFVPDELLSFIRYYGNWLKSAIRTQKAKRI